MKKIFAIMSLILLSACASTVEDDDFAFFQKAADGSEYMIMPIDNSFKLVREEQITEESDEPGVTLSAKADESMYYFKIYNKRIYSRNILRANMSGSLKGVIVPLEFRDGQVYEPLGTVDINGRVFKVINPKRHNLLLVAEDGTIAPVLGRRKSETSNLITLSFADIRPFPKLLKIVKDTETKEETDEPLVGMEIIYKGRVKGLYTIAFRDFDGSGKEKFLYTTVTQDHELVDFGNIKLNMLSVEPNKIYYSLVENGK